MLDWPNGAVRADPKRGKAFFGHRRQHALPEPVPGKARATHGWRIDIQSGIMCGRNLHNRINLRAWRKSSIGTGSSLAGWDCNGRQHDSQTLGIGGFRRHPVCAGQRTPFASRSAAFRDYFGILGAIRARMFLNWPDGANLMPCPTPEDPLFPAHRGVAQPGSASALGAEGRRFKSGRPDHRFAPRSRWRRQIRPRPGDVGDGAGPREALRRDRGVS